MEYRVINYWGNNLVVTWSDRKAHKYTREIDVNGEKVKVENTINAPAFMGMKGLALCGRLKPKQTLDQWIARNDKKFRV